MSKFIYIQDVDGERFFNLEIVSHIDYKPGSREVWIYFAGDADPVILKRSPGEKFIQCLRTAAQTIHRVTVEDEIAELVTLRP